MPAGGGPKPKSKLRKGETLETQLFEETLLFISKVPLFQSIPLSDHPTLAKAFVLKDFAEGTNVITQGDMGDSFYVVRKGKAKVVVDEKVVNTLGTGDFFGELSLIHERPRNATITAIEGPLQCSSISKEDFTALDLRKKLNFKKRKAVMMVESTQGPPATHKSAAEKAFIKEAFTINKNIGPFLKGLSDQQLTDISDQAFVQEIESNKNVIVQGDTKADLFYILQEGTAEAIKDGEKVDEYAPKGSFGGLALLYQAPRAATVRTTSVSKLWCIPRSAMRAVLQQEVKNRVAGFAKLLGKVKIFDALSVQEKEMVADALMETTFSKGENVTVQGEDSDAFFMLEEGELALIENSKQLGTMKARPGQDFPYFGERAMAEDMPYYTTRKVLSPKAKLLMLPKTIYQRVIRVEEEKAGIPKDYIAYDAKKLTEIGLLGCGGFGKVTLERYEPTGEHFALKKLSKGFVLAKHQEKSVMNEKRILKMTHSPFLVQCAATFNGAQHLMFLLEPALGGELFTIYMVNELHGKERLALFYSACVVKGLHHLHERCIVYRDMKPENLLLDEKGYCKIADFGLAKFCVGKTFTTCGTPDYFAPELVKGVGHTTSLDWWTLGILIFELMTGVTPFAADDPQFIIAKMMKGFDNVKFPAEAEGAKWPQLVKELCKMDPSERLPVRPGGVKNLEEDEWYKKNRFNWGLLTARKMTPPFLPEVSDGDPSNFEASEEEAPPEVRYVDPKNGWDAEFEDLYGPEKFTVPQITVHNRASVESMDDDEYCKRISMND